MILKILKQDLLKKKIIKWTARLLALGLLLFSLPFYFGYGNPVPFLNPDYSFLDNLWLLIFPLVFISLALGWKYEKLAGILLIMSISTGLLATLIIENEFIFEMMIPLFIGILYLITAFNNNN
ncbi:hypothetical protein C8C76_104104 [Halanaerobium saccharolyticum]|jgi:hypothetical protein|uniref:DUF7670 domain-containing protein n=1 Tax=Halanaerobium saccharolyticum TaxID=43595 RepID=A0A2T5RPN2_9FIRM|nr:hypothetical protein [Halanaerobium saccharolyticum]PTW01750.1 hypothetical protein C8C76_104104 [Halanaerobium saccharolyticum]